jgi:hypothetical protein
MGERIGRPLSWPTVSNAMNVAPEARGSVEQLRVRPEVLETEDGLAAARSCVLGFLQLFTFTTSSHFPRIAEGCAGLCGSRRREAPRRPAAGSTPTCEGLERRLGQRYPMLAVLYFARYADAHSPTRLGPR